MKLIVLVAALALAGVIGCDDDNEAPASTATAAPTNTATATADSPAPTATETASPDQGGRTGVEDLDLVIKAVESHDVAALQALLEFEQLECSDETGAGGGPRCGADQEAGTPVDAFPFATCELEWRGPDDVQGALDETVAIAPVLFAAFEAPSGYLRAEADQIALFAGPDPRLDGAAERGVLVGVRAGRVVEIRLDCGAGNDPRTMIPDEVTSFLVPPP